MIKTFFKKRRSLKTWQTAIVPLLRMLKIKCPPVVFMECLYKHYVPEYGEERFFGQDVFDTDKIPADAKHIAGVFLDEEGVIGISKRLPDWNLKDMTQTFCDLTEEEKIFFLVHELRHVWQRTYEAEKYYQYNADSYEVINDISEIDSDAFAIAYCFTKLSYKPESLPHVMREIHLQATLDKGKRWARANELALQYGFENIGNIEVVRKSADKDLLNLLNEAKRKHLLIV